MVTLGQIAFEAGMLEIAKHVDLEGVEASWQGLGEVKRKAWEAAAAVAGQAAVEEFCALWDIKL